MLEDLTELPGRVRAELTRLRAERETFVAEQDRLKNLLAETEEQLRIARADHEELRKGEQRAHELRQQAERAEQEAGELAARLRAVESDVATVRSERDSLRAELANCRKERDEIRLRLLDAELALAAGEVAGSGPAAEVEADRGRSVAAERRAAEIARELEATRQTVSWRVTAPLRAVRRRTQRP
ncbi:hypothetical protein [Amycolatopsis aidingensis]|uniref:hypothetical protein n=1 Tax=Amycolatopsis aidingensis TaxID=2842453 RepID=UPI001C0C6F3B|nr:hypothetical protein [Amycolatopsis aidingensis]